MKTNEQVSAGLVDFTDPTLLLTGSAGGLCALADFFGAQATFANLQTSKFLNPIAINLIFHLGAKKTQLLKVGNQIDWFISSPDARQYSELIREIVEADKPSHAYLDVPGNTEMEIVVSMGEYDPATIFAH